MALLLAAPPLMAGEPPKDAGSGEAEPYRVVAKRQAPPPSREVLAILNAPLSKPLSPEEEKLRPVIKKLEKSLVCGVWVLLILGAAGVSLRF